MTVIQKNEYVHKLNLVKVSDSDYDVKKLANERPLYTVMTNGKIYSGLSLVKFF